ncbi:MAG: hypothetical protein ACOVO0_13235, partial [Burkholderiaceae bacterium]
SQKILSITRIQVGGGDVKLFSALKKQGIEDVSELLFNWARLPSSTTPRDLQTDQVSMMTENPDSEEPPSMEAK